MKLNAKIIGAIVVGFLVVSISLTASSVFTLLKNQTETIQLFKQEFLELARESFTNSSALFFAPVEKQLQSTTSSAQMMATIQDIDPDNKNVIIYSIPKKRFLVEPEDDSIAALIDEKTLNTYIQKNTLDLTTTFDLDNFQTFLSDTTAKSSPVKVQLRFYADNGLIIGYAKTFPTAKVRIEFIQRKNEQLFQSYILFAVSTVIVVLVFSIVMMVVLMQTIVINPLKLITNGLDQVKKGILNAKITIKSKDEIGEIASTFNIMTVELQDSRGKLQEYNKSLEQNVKDRTEELNVKVNELEHMNKLMVDRELKMIELKKQLKELEEKLPS